MAWTTPRTWSTGDPLNATNLNANIRDNLNAIGGAWTSYTPSWTASTTNPAVGNGSLSGAYMAAGKLIHFRVSLTLGTTSSIGVGNYFFSFPVTPLTTLALASGGLAFDASAGTRRPVQWVPQNTSTFFLVDTSTGSVMTQGSPWTWAVGDSITVGGTYEAA